MLIVFDRSSYVVTCLVSYSVVTPTSEYAPSSAANLYIMHVGVPPAMNGLRDAFLMYLLLALLAYGAVKIVTWVVPTGYSASPLAAVVLVVDPGLYLDPLRSAHYGLLDALDVPAYLAMVSSAFFLYVAVARVLAPRAASATAMVRVFRVTLAPFWEWVDASAAAADGLLRAEKPRDSLLAMALAAYVTYLVIRLADVVAIVFDHPDPPLAALRGALYGAIAAATIPVETYHALLRAVDSLAFLSMIGASPLFASIASRTVIPACARLWRRL